MSDKETTDDIESLCETGSLNCQVCNASLQPLSVQQRQEHYDLHFENPSMAKDNNLNLDTTFEQGKHATISNVEKASSHNEFWFPTQSTPPPRNFTPGAIHVLKHALLKTHARGLTSKAVLCHSGATHISTEFGDMTWGCGYRNFLMACASLMTQEFQPLYFPLLDDSVRPPGIRNLQFWIEDAWANGFDREGAEDLKHKLVGTRKWIGTAELYVAFTSKGVPASLVDFPGTKRGPEAVVEWIVGYFSPREETKHPVNAFEALKEAKPIVVSDRMPIILQHAGHSQTVVGYETNKKGDHNLLVFDPARKIKKNLRQAAMSYHSPSSNSHGKERNLFDRLFHPQNNATIDRKRRIINSDNGKREIKRAKGKHRESIDGDKDIIVISDESEELDGDESLEDLDPVLVVNSFRLNQKKLAKKDKYQILYFPLDNPLTEEERWARRVVTSVVYL